MGAGIRVQRISPDFRRARVVMRLTWYNRNFVGTHFGGSLYGMCDPFYMLMLMHILGPREFWVWDLAASIRYKRPGKGDVYAEFDVSDELVEELRRLEPNEKKIVELPVNVYHAMDGSSDNVDNEENGSGNDETNLVASLTKTIYIKRKPLKSNGSDLATDTSAADPPRSKL